MGAALKFKTSQVPRQKGERARVKVVQGPDYGAIYVVVDGKASIGRGEDNDIVISDLKSSRNHAEIKLTQTGWIVRDLGSANGILVNGKLTREAPLQVRDSVTIGETVLEFLTAEQGTLMLVAPPRSLDQIKLDQENYEIQKERVRAIGKAAAGVPGAAASQSKKDPKRVLVLGVLVLGAAFLLLSPDEKPKAGKKPIKKSDVLPTGEELEKYLPGGEVAPLDKSADIFFRNGFREYREHNWLRAKLQFETVLQMAPTHRLAQLYLTNCDTKIKEEVKSHLESGIKSYKAGRLKSAKGHFEAVLRLLYRDQTNPAYIESTEQLDKVIKDMKAEVSR